MQSKTRYTETATGTGWDLLKAVRGLIWSPHLHEVVFMRASWQTMYQLTMDTVPMGIDQTNKQLWMGEASLYGHEVIIDEVPFNTVEVTFEVPESKNVTPADLHALRQKINEMGWRNAVHGQVEFD